MTHPHDIEPDEDAGVPDFDSPEAEAAYDLALEIHQSRLAGDWTGFAADTAE